MKTKVAITNGKRRRLSLKGWPAVLRLLRRYPDAKVRVFKGSYGTAATVEIAGVLQS